jgi:membrane-associated protease RseP (regulator of RpoE activity)
MKQEIEDHREDRGKLEIEESISRIYPFISRVFDVYEIQKSGDILYFFGTPKADTENVMGELWAPLEQRGLGGTLKYELGEHVLIGAPLKKEEEKVWINLALFIATIFTTMICGAWMFGVDLSMIHAGFEGLPFTLAIMAVLGSHEMAHYAMAKYHGMKTSLPYFIPFPTFIGTMGAVIHYRGPIPNRKALFDVGVAGPLVGLFVSVAVTIIGLKLDVPAVNRCLIP